jgi:hypothetical protein
VSEAQDNDYNRGVDAGIARAEGTARFLRTQVANQAETIKRLRDDGESAIDEATREARQDLALAVGMLIAAGALTAVNATNLAKYLPDAETTYS